MKITDSLPNLSVAHSLNYKASVWPWFHEVFYSKPFAKGFSIEGITNE